eukprot:COSAG02_NODE_22167_length_761_cov_1.209970_1_plen_37_part_10
MRIDGVIKTDGACDTSSNHARASSKQLRGQICSFYL